MVCFFCNAECDTVVCYFVTGVDLRKTETGCCAKCLEKRVAVPLGYKSGLVKGRSRHRQHAKKKERSPRSRGLAAAECERGFEEYRKLTIWATLVATMMIPVGGGEE
jgi:hypothetical protein